MHALDALSPRAFGWKADRKAGHAVRVATDAIRASEAPADGAVALFERLWPATMQVNRAPGDLDAAVERAVTLLEPPLVAGVHDAEGHPARLEQLWAAIEADRGGVTDPLAQRWGHLCGTPRHAAAWADRLVPAVRRAWMTDPAKRCAAALPCLSAMTAAGQGPKLLAMFSVGGPTAWPIRRFAAPLLLAQRGADAALAFAEAANVHSPRGKQDRARFCERALLEAGRRDEAWRRFALDAHHAHTHVHTHEALARAYPERDAHAILEALVAHHPGDEGKLFATARAIGDLDRATALARTTPGDPKVPLHAARDVAGADPDRAGEWTWITVDWLCSGRVYKVTRKLVAEVCGLAVELEGEAARARLAAVAGAARATSARNWIRAWLDGVLDKD